MKSSILRALFVLGSLILLSCTPTFNWREVQHPDGLWSAAFPEKPVQVTRTLTLARDQQPPLEGVVVTLWSARVGEQTFTIGQSSAPGVEPETLRANLVRARLLNIGVRRPTAPGATAEPIDELGQMRLSPEGPPVPARLQIKTFVQADQVLEALVAGPVSGFDTLAAETFLQSAIFSRP